MLTVGSQAWWWVEEGTLLNPRVTVTGSAIPSAALDL
jgi:hypothetical protein